MLDAIKRWISGSRQGRDWQDLSDWAQQQGHGFKRAREGGGFVIDGSYADRPWGAGWGGRRFVIDGSSADRPWRLEWGPPQRSYIARHELRLRIELKLSSNLQMLL